jgi:hypothetical protein
VALSPSASPAAPVVAIMQVASIFLVNFMFFQSVVGTPGPRVVELLVLLK